MNPPITSPSPCSSYHLSPSLFSAWMLPLPQSRMPSQPLTLLPLPSPTSCRHHATFLTIVSASSALIILALLLLLYYLYCSVRYIRTHNRTIPLDSPVTSSLRHFYFRNLCSTTASFDPSRSLMHDASTEVFHGLLPDGKSIVMKCLDLPSLLLLRP